MNEDQHTKSEEEQGEWCEFCESYGIIRERGKRRCLRCGWVASCSNGEC